MTCPYNHLSTSQVGSVLTGLYTGQLDAVALPTLAQFAQQLLASTGIRSVLLDVSQATQVDAVGMSGLVAVNEALLSMGATLRISGASPLTAQLLSQAGLGSTLSED